MVGNITATGPPGQLPQVDAPTAPCPRGMPWSSLKRTLEHINEGYWCQDLSQPNQWINCPASYHNKGCAFTFADGHGQIKVWTDKIFRRAPARRPPPPVLLPIQPPRTWLGCKRDLPSWADEVDGLLTPPAVLPTGAFQSQGKGGAFSGSVSIWFGVPPSGGPKPA